MPSPINPFEPPSTPLSRPAGPVVWRSQWVLLRWIPVLYFGSFGVIGVAGLVGMIGLLIFSIAATGEPAAIFQKEIRSFLWRCPAYAMLAGFSYFTTREWYRCHWLRAIVASVIFLASLGGIGFVMSRWKGP